MSRSTPRPSRSLLWRLSPLSAALLIASQAHAVELPQQVITANPLGSTELAAKHCAGRRPTDLSLIHI